MTRLFKALAPLLLALVAATAHSGSRAAELPQSGAAAAVAGALR